MSNYEDRLVLDRTDGFKKETIMSDLNARMEEVKDFLKKNHIKLMGMGKLALIMQWELSKRPNIQTLEQKPALHEPVTLPQRIAELVEKHESLRATARVLEIDPGYLSRLASGEKCEPGATLLRRLGLRQITSYERI